MKAIDVFAIEESDAKVEQLCRTIGELLAMIRKAGGHTWPHEQELMRRARAQLVEMGKSVNREDT